MKIIIFGPPGAGKGTFSAMIEEDYGLHLFVMGDELRAARDEGGEFAERLKKTIGTGNLVDDECLLDLVRSKLVGVEKFILDGFPRTIPQCTFLDSIFGNAIDAFIDLQVDESVLVDRLMNRGRSDDTEEVIVNRMRVFKTQTAPVWKYLKARTRHIQIDGNGPIDDVYGAIRSGLDKITS